jgi:hypothetical protein
MTLDIAELVGYRYPRKNLGSKDKGSENKRNVTCGKKDQVRRERATRKDKTKMGLDLTRQDNA